jgi:hypothetical protein
MNHGVECICVLCRPNLNADHNDIFNSYGDRDEFDDDPHTDDDMYEWDDEFDELEESSRHARIDWDEYDRLLKAVVEEEKRREIFLEEIEDEVMRRGHLSVFPVLR